MNPAGPGASESPAGLGRCRRAGSLEEAVEALRVPGSGSHGGTSNLSESLPVEELLAEDLGLGDRERFGGRSSER